MKNLKLSQDLSVLCIKAITNMYDGMFGSYPNPFDQDPVKFNFDGTDGSIGVKDGTLYIMFSGSNSIQDWIQNFKFWKKPVQKLAKLKSTVKPAKLVPYFASLKAVANDKILVEAGFQEHYMAVRDYIRQQAMNYDKIVITGHSLGGATACLCAYDFMNLWPDKNITAVMFASPRVGNSAFVKDFNARIPQAVRWNYMCDIVPKLPPMWMGYHHCSNQQEVTTWKEKFQYMLAHPIYAIFGNFKHHDLTNYQKIVQS